jgi:hypothetical protein
MKDGGYPLHLSVTIYKPMEVAASMTLDHKFAVTTRMITVSLTHRLKMILTYTFLTMKRYLHTAKSALNDGKEVKLA